MSAVETLGLASRARQAVLDALTELGAPNLSGDSGAFYPAPVGVLVGLPTLVSRGLAASTYTVPVFVVSGDPLNDTRAVDRLYALADDCALTLRIDSYRASSWQGGATSEPQPAIEMQATITIRYMTEEAR